MENNDNENTSTYGNPQNEKTQTYNNSENQKTTAYNSKQDNTAAYADLQNKEFKSRTHGIGIGDNVVLKGNQFSVTGIISEGTGEAVIYKIEDENKNTFALKLYFEFGNPKEEPNYETLKRIKEISDPDILKLHDFGVGVDKYQGRYCYEISDFAAGGDLFGVTDFKSKYSKSFIEQNIVPEILNGIRKLHEFKIYHCDLKPSNIFFKDTQQTDILIGDYGSAKAYDLETEKEVRKSSTVKGTDAYLSPEQARGIISEKNDYYSFGVILLHLLYTEQFSNENNIRQVDKRKFEKIVERQYNSQQVVNFNTEYKRLNNLIEGLTLINHINRFGKKEVDRWLNGEEVEVRYKSESISIQPISLSKQRFIKTDADLIRFIENEDDWRDELFEDETTKNDFFRWIDNTRGKDERNKVKEFLNFYTIEDSKIEKAKRDYESIGYVREALLRYFDPERDIRIDMNSFNFFVSNNIKKEIESYISTLDNIWKKTSTDKLRFYLFQLEFSLRQLKIFSTQESTILLGSILDKMYSVFGLIQKPLNDFKTEIQSKINPNDNTSTFRHFANLFYAFNPERTFKDSKNVPLKTLDDLGLYYVQTESAFTDKYLTIEKERFLQKLNKSELKMLNYKEFIFEIFKDKAEAQIELVNLTFDKNRNYLVSYKFYKSLNTFLSNNSITVDFTSRSKENEIYVNKRKFLQSFNSECDHFISTVTSKHNIISLNEGNLSEIRNKFIKNSWRQYLKLYFGTILFSILFTALLIFTLGTEKGKSFITKNFTLSKDSKNEVETKNIDPNINKNLYFLKSKAALRSRATVNASVILYAKKGDMVELLQEITPKWYKVNISGNIGYIQSSKLNFNKSNLNNNLINSNSNSKSKDGIAPEQPKLITNDIETPVDSKDNEFGIEKPINKKAKSDIIESSKEKPKRYNWVRCNDCNGAGTLNIKNICNACDGSGNTMCTKCNGSKRFICNKCDGNKTLPCTKCNGYKTLSCTKCNGYKTLPCTKCNGFKTVNGKFCSSCGAKGFHLCSSCGAKGYHLCSSCSAKGYNFCSSCGSKGYHDCSSCNSTGKLRCRTCYGKGEIVEKLTCTKCNGGGQIEVEI